MTDPRRRAEEPAPLASGLAAGLVAFAFLLQIAAASWLWTMLNGGWLVDRGTYRGFWATSGYRGLPIEDVASGLNQRLPLETPIRLGPILAGNGQWVQRLKEGLYPRRVQTDAPFTLELQKGGKPALAQSLQGAFVLTGKLPPPPSPPASGKVDFTFSLPRVVLRLLAALGWGLALVVLLGRGWRRTDFPAPWLAAAALAAPVVFGVFGTAATLAQKPLPWTVLTVVGLVLGAAALAVTFRGRALRDELRRRFAWVRNPESWALVAFSAVLLRHMVIWPIVGWDGRSIWLFRAKQVLHHGYLTIADAVNPENFFSHMEYPLLFPTWLAHFGAAGPLREKELGVAIMLLQVLLFTVVWWLSRNRLGRWPGTAFAVAVLIVTAAMSERGFADGFLTMFLLAMMFLLDHEELEPFGWLAGLGAALTKGEGLVFALMVAGLFLVAHPRSRARRWWLRFLPGLALLPGLAPPLWARAIGIRNQYADAKLPTSSEVAWQRADVIWTGILKLVRESPPLAYMLAGLGLYLLLEYLGRRSWLARISVGTALGIFAFSVAVMMVTPYGLASQVDTALGRLLLHSTVLLAAAPLVALAAPPADSKA